MTVVYALLVSHLLACVHNCCSWYLFAFKVLVCALLVTIHWSSWPACGVGFACSIDTLTYREVEQKQAKCMGTSFLKRIQRALSRECRYITTQRYPLPQRFKVSRYTFDVSKRNIEMGWPYEDGIKSNGKSSDCGVKTIVPSDLTGETEGITAAKHKATCL